MHRSLFVGIGLLLLGMSVLGCSTDTITAPVSAMSDDDDVITIEGTNLGSIRGKSYTIPFSDAGVVNLEAGSSVSTSAPLRLFEFEPAETPDSGVFTITNAMVSFERTGDIPLPLFGTATVRLSLASGIEDDACDDAKRVAEVDVRLTTGIASILDGETILTDPVLASLAGNEVTVCVEVESDFDGTMNLSAFEVAFDGGESIPTLLLTNDSSEEISLLGPGELFGPNTALQPGETRLVTAEGATDAITVRAGLLSEGLLESGSCPAPTGRNYVGTVSWDGTAFVCSVEEDPPLDVDDSTPETIQVPLYNRFGDAALASPTNTIDGVDYAVNRVFKASSTGEDDEDDLLMDLDVNALGLRQVETIYVATYSDSVPDVANGTAVATLRVSSPGLSSREEIALTLGEQTADWSHDRPEHTTELGGARHDKPRSLYTFDTRLDSDSDYTGAVYGFTVTLDPPRNVTTISLSLADADALGERDAAMAGLFGQAISAITLEGPPVAASTDTGTGTETDTGTEGGSDEGDGDETDPDQSDDEADEDDPVATGTASGTVTDATSGTALSGVSVVVDSGTPSSTTEADGSYSFSDLTVGTHTITVTRPGYVSITTTIVVSADNPATTEFEMFAAGTVTGTVVDAQNGNGLEGVTIAISGTTTTTTTNADGEFTFTEAPEGERTLTASRTGYVSATVPVTVDPDNPAELSVGLLAVGGGGSGIAVTLAWSESPRDLDLHMSGPDGSGGRFHIAYYALSPVDHGSLDLDDTSSFGPETVTVTSINDSYVAGDYQVWIHNFSSETGFDTSGGIVTLYAGGQQFAQFLVEDATGSATDDIWRVVSFTIDTEGTVTATSELQSFTTGTAQSEF
ncbi:MAG: carboxypeptidase-like regulatory domain-containing protein [Phycisphaerae bacterium]